ncbi:MAG: DUF4291 domain-containing protein [Planctomycetota bacterium]
MNLRMEPYLSQRSIWPNSGRMILANFDNDSIVVYQAYCPEIGHFAVDNGYFGGDFKFSRMSWIKPNFLWMMHRCGWASKRDQEVVLAIRLKRSAFDQILADAVHSSFQPDLYESLDSWQHRVANSDVRLQWDPDHAPSGERLDRRAIQIGLRGKTLRNFASEWIVEVIDVSDFVRQQSAHRFNSKHDRLLMPRERIYPVSCERTIQNLGVERTS